jgi:NhaP-type Na+/H+ or K+/H+ antiporter
MPTANPHQSPQASSDQTTRRRSPLSWTLLAIPWTVVIGLTLGSLYCIYRNYLLRGRYPNLEDHSPGMDSYWPQLEHLLNNMMAITLAAIALIVAGATFAWQRRRKTEKTAPSSEDAAESGTS